MRVALKNENADWLLKLVILLYQISVYVDAVHW